MSEELKRAVASYENYIQRKGVDTDVIHAMIEASKVGIVTEKDLECGLKVSNRAKQLINQFCINSTGGNIDALERYAFDNKTWYELLDWHYDVLKLESHDLLESFILYMEKGRYYKDRFYQPRVNPLKRDVDAMQDLFDDKLDEIFINHPSRVGKTQIVKFGYLFYGSKYPEKSNLYTAYSDKITSGFYDGILELMYDPTYKYAEIFPENIKTRITDGKDLTIDLIRKKTYPTFTMRSIYGTLNGACDCSGIAVADDLFSGIEEAISEDRQITVWGKFDNNFMKRLKRKAKLINMGTRWAPRDVQGRRLALLESKPEYQNRRWKKLIIPALDENDESNFDYPYDLGYSTEDYKMIRASFEENDDMASWFAQDQQTPTDRFGALLSVGNMSWYEPSEMPQGTPDRLFAACDPAFGGGDFTSMPICYQFGNEYYVPDVVYNNGDKEATVPEVTRRIAYHSDKFDGKTSEVRFEETKSTEEYRHWCEKQWDVMGVPVNATHVVAPNTSSKVDRIRNHAPDIRKIHFLKPEYRTLEYNKFITNMLTFKTEGRNKNDDGIDSAAQLCDMIFGEKRARAKIEAIVNPMRGGGYYGY